MLNGKEIAANGWITNYDPEHAVQQHGIDLRVDRIGRIKEGTSGWIASLGKTILPGYEEIEPTPLNIWDLVPGYYQISFKENMYVPKDKMCLLIQRSSAARCGIWLFSSVFDAGFSVEGISTFFMVHHKVHIEYGARLAQALFYDCTEVENLYQGSYMGQSFHE